MLLQEHRIFRPSTIVQPTRSKIIFPAFEEASTEWTGASDLILEAPLGNTTSISFKYPITKFGINFILAVRWTSGGHTYRYALWEDEAAVFYYPVYSGQAIGPSAVLEVWTVNSTGAPLLLTAQTLYSSVLNTSTICSPCCTLADISTTLTLQAPTISNTFCAEGVTPTPDEPGGGILTVEELSAQYPTYWIAPFSGFGVEANGEITYPNMISGAEAAFWVQLFTNEWDSWGIPYSDRILAWYFTNQIVSLYDFNTRYATGVLTPEPNGNDSYVEFEAPWVLTFLWTP